MFPTHILSFVEILVRQGVRHFVIAPGSRNAPLVLALARHPLVHTHIAADERAAAYHALGMAVALNYGNTEGMEAGAACQPVAVVTTSGTAALNLLPGVAEALLSQVPLLLLTADRPPEWIGQQDGQAVWQEGAFGRHVKASFQLPAAPAHPDEHWQVNRIANEACLLAGTSPYGPVHINIPFREPFYPAPDEAFAWPEHVRVWEWHGTDGTLPRAVLVPLLQTWQGAGRRMIVCGPMPNQSALRNAVKALIAYAPDVVVLADVAANLHGLGLPTEAAGGWADYILSEKSIIQDAPPDVVLHLGGGLTSRRLRKYLQSLGPQTQVWRLQSEAFPVADAMQHLTKLIIADPAALITRLGEHSFFEQRQDAYKPSLAEIWQEAAVPVGRAWRQALEQRRFSEVQAVLSVLEALPEFGHLHLGNSMPIRWAQWLSGLQGIPGGVRVWANRGASGIDGCTATAVGYARMVEQTAEPVWLLTGETGALYDRNGLWLAGPLPANLKVIVLNNGGGTIFRLIDGPAAHPERGVYFENRHNLTLRRTAEDFGLTYHDARDLEGLHIGLAHLATQPGPALLEIFASPEAASELMKKVKELLE